MSLNWMRHFELQLLDQNGQGVSLSDFKVTFQIEWADTRWPRVANVKIYNLSTDTTNKILGQEFAKVRIIAGYDGIAPDVDASQVGVAREISPDQIGQVNGQNYGLILTVIFASPSPGRTTLRIPGCWTRTGRAFLCQILRSRSRSSGQIHAGRAWQT